MNGTDRPPRLAVVITPHTPGLELFEIAAGRWEYLWVTDRSVGAGLDRQVRILKRLGTVIDITGLDSPAAAELLAPHEPTGIIGFDDIVVLRAAQLGHELALAANSVETVRRYTNKHLQREALEAAGLPVPQHWSIPAGADKDLIEEITESVVYPAILKPQSGQGSRETHRVDDATAARAILGGDGGGVTEDLIIEEYLRDGWPRAERPYADMVSVESIVVEGRVNHLAVTGRATLVDPFREAGNFIPSTLDADERAAVLDVATRAIEAMGATIGAVHTEIKLTPDGPRVIEVNGRIGGMISSILLMAAGRDFLEITCRVALGEMMNFDSLLHCDRVGFSMISPPPVGATTLIASDGIERVSQIDGVETISINRTPGAAVDWREGFDSRLFLLFGVADTHEGMWHIRRQIDETVHARFS